MDLQPSELILLGMVFLFFASLTSLVFLMLVRRRERLEARLEAPPSSDPAIGSTPELVLGDMTSALSGQIPMSAEDRNLLQRDLRAAGYYRPTALMEYTAVRAVLTITPIIAGALLTAIWTDTLAEAVRIWIGAVVTAMLGYGLPRVYLYFKGQSRKAAIERGLPTAIDMLTLCLSAGLNVMNSLERVADELMNPYPELGYELQIVRRQSDLRSLEFALVQFADRVDLPQLRNISVILSQSEKIGTDGVSVLREYADNMRMFAKQSAEAMANRAPIKMLAPGYLIGAGLLILVITPPAMEVADFKENNVARDIKLEGRETLKKAGLSTEKVAPPPVQDTP